MGNQVDSLEDLLANVVKDENGCWLWQGSLVAGGYGQLSSAFLGGKRRWYIAHRIAYMLVKGVIPDGMELDHLCKIRNCVNPDHLEPVDRMTNVRRSTQVHPTHCPKGHEYTTENTAMYKGSRYCRECKRQASRANLQKRSPTP